MQLVQRIKTGHVQRPLLICVFGSNGVQQAA